MLYPFLSEYPIECPPFIHGLSYPYYIPGDKTEDKPAVIQSSLSKVIYQLLEMYSTTQSHHGKVWPYNILFTGLPLIFVY